MFTREDTKIIKGMAVTLMILHHLWAFPERLPGGELKCLLSVSGESAIMYLGMFGKICVSLFFFVGGYGMYKTFQEQGVDLFRKLKGLYLSYWKVFVIFVPLGFIFFRDYPVYYKSSEFCNRFSVFSWDELLKNFLGIYSTYSSEWWFFQSYIYAVVSFVVVKKILDRYSAAINITIIILGSILVTNILPVIGNIEMIGTLNNNFLYKAFLCQPAPYIACFWMGGGMAKDDLLIKLQIQMKKNNMLNPISDVIILVLIVYIRTSGPGDALDIFYVPVMIVAILDLVKRIHILENMLLYIGKQSTNMWLIHGFFCYYFYDVVRLVVAPQWGVLSLILLMLLTYFASLLVTYIWNMEKKIVVIAKKKLDCK
ncbi:hypothetical protein C805_00486 [Eubacterium sp. 14-2]|uniref:acyltransferase family protein n=1 Tax=Eubacterium sp. 14-2 TaxID=1235790 RepID=UPI0003373EBC|nr:acyltransferase family protein [Eubacterium sp. 14-2]EOT28344.1 hypothetical protein C805_00486 [Eubacterium sp. 14-2]